MGIQQIEWIKQLWWVFLMKASRQSTSGQTRAFLLPYLLYLILLAHADPNRELDWVRRHVKSGTKENTDVIPSFIMTVTQCLGWYHARLCQGSCQGAWDSQVDVLLEASNPFWRTFRQCKLLLFHLFFCQHLDLTEKQITKYHISHLFYPLCFELKRTSSVKDSSPALLTIWTHLNNTNDNADQLL